MTPVFDKIFKSAVKFCSKHSVEIAMGAAAVGVGLTIFTTAKATLKVNDIVHDDTLTKKEKVKKSVMPVAPAVGATALTYTALAAMYVFGRKKQAALLTLAMTTLQTFQTYRNNVRKDIGMKKESEEYAKAVIESKSLDEKRPDIPKTEDEIIFCESATGQFFSAKLSDVYKAMYLANREFIIKGELELNDWLDILGIDTRDEYYGIGWDQTMGWEFFGYQFIDICMVPHFDKSGKEYRLLTYPFMPHTMESTLFESDLTMEDAITLNPCVDTDLWKKTSHDEKMRMLSEAKDCL